MEKGIGVVEILFSDIKRLMAILKSKEVKVNGKKDIYQVRG